MLLRGALRCAVPRVARTAATLAAAARIANSRSICDALGRNRVAVGSLTLVAVLSLFMFLRQLHALDRERAAQRATLVRLDRLNESLNKGIALKRRIGTGTTVWRACSFGPNRSAAR